MAEHGVARRMSLLDRWLTLWIGAAMVAGVGLGYLWPEPITALNEATRVGTTSIPMAVVIGPPSGEARYTKNLAWPNTS